MALSGVMVVMAMIVTLSADPFAWMRVFGHRYTHQFFPADDLYKRESAYSTGSHDRVVTFFYDEKLIRGAFSRFKVWIVLKACFRD